MKKIILALLFFLAYSPNLGAQAPFFQGKTIRIIAGYPAGDVNDQWPRLIGQFMGKYIPGNPVIIVQNMTGAGSMVAANYVYSAVKPDGLTLGWISPALYFDQLEGTPVASGPQMMTTASLVYDRYNFFGSFDMSFFAKDYLLDGGTYMATQSIYQGLDSKGRELWQSSYDNQLPTRVVFDFNAGYNFNFGKQIPLKGTISAQVLNIFNSDFFASADRFGVIPGVKRSYRANVSLGW